MKNLTGYYVKKDQKGRIVSASTMPQGKPIYEEVAVPITREVDGETVQEHISRMEIVGFETVEGEEFVKGEMPADLEIYRPLAPDMIAAERNRLLSESDWIVTRSAEMGEPIPQAWQAFRAALRAIDDSADPDSIEWPVKPE